jgi:hypothetical protein
VAVRWDSRASRRPDRDQPVFDIRTMGDLRSVSLVVWRIGGALMAAFVGFAPVLAAMEFRGVMALRVLLAIDR